ncbi:ribonuclease H-like domain-containing protein [Flavobacterium sp.]|uniref:3'-5' exonuclease n=1 Tax=Flavobacterium sp. TaxID=239 RepID=UPI00261B5AED|nr:ribonuclease H-like domain-containing protein [Flavobacterium sp.]
MFDWIKNINKPYPEFWTDYLSKFDEKSNRYIALSVETTGIDPKKDVVLSFGAVGINNDTIIVSDYFEVLINQNNSEKSTSLSEAEAMEAFVNYIENATLVGHRIHFDVDIINEALDKIDCGRLKNEALDIEIMHKKLHEISDKNYSLDELISHYKIPKSDRHSSGDNAFSIALMFLKLKSKLRLK